MKDEVKWFFEEMNKGFKRIIKEQEESGKEKIIKEKVESGKRSKDDSLLDGLGEGFKKFMKEMGEKYNKSGKDDSSLDGLVEGFKKFMKEIGKCRKDKVKRVKEYRVALPTRGDYVTLDLADTRLVASNVKGDGVERLSGVTLLEFTNSAGVIHLSNSYEEVAKDLENYKESLR